ncbi:MAG: DNA polymerase III subunit epsilon [Alphaproteobacteria bacterium]|nr:DNA polymerase III subunit epsilon [Alphaproteobacteria bacterium]
MREIVFDTETTGMDPFEGDRIIEIGAVELVNHLPTGKTIQLYINPERDVPPEAVAVHGITNEFLADKLVFSQVYTDFMDFISTDTILIAHNAEFDMKFLNWELEQVGHPPVEQKRVVDSLVIARQKFPGSPANLDALCRRFDIDNSNRSYHGALLDSELLAEVYLELLGGRQRGLGLMDEESKRTSSDGNKPGMGTNLTARRTYREPRTHSPSAEELLAHKEFLSELTDPLWKKLGGHR